MPFNQESIRNILFKKAAIGIYWVDSGYFGGDEMNRFVFLAVLFMFALSGCGSKKLEIGECPTSQKAEEPINDPGLPPVVSDDGRFTHLRFGLGQETPNITALRTDGTERRVDSNFDPNSRVVTVFGIYPTIVLRAGNRVACLRNATYDPRSPQSRAVSVGGDGAIW